MFEKYQKKQEASSQERFYNDLMDLQTYILSPFRWQKDIDLGIAEKSKAESEIKKSKREFDKLYKTMQKNPCFEKMADRMERLYDIAQSSQFKDNDELEWFIYEFKKIEETLQFEKI